MKIAIVGATGFVGTYLLAEAVERGHQVTAITRNPEKVPANKNVKAVKADVNNENDFAAAIEGHDAVITSVHFTQIQESTIANAVRKVHVPRLLVVGGAGSLEIAPGKLLFDIPEFPEAYKAEAKAGGAFLEDLKKETDLNWTFLSPSAEFIPAPKTGKFRLGKDQLLTDAQGKSSINNGDYAVAMLDEVEKPQHLRQRFTVGY